MGALVWLLWPGDLRWLDNPEAAVAFFTALIVWVCTEFKQAFAEPEFAKFPRDIRLSRELISLHQNELRTLLKDTDLWSFVDSIQYSKCYRLVNRRDVGEFTFLDEVLEQKAEDFFVSLGALAEFIAANTAPEQIAGGLMTGFKPARYVTDEEYERLRQLADQANSLASNAWDTLEAIVLVTRKRCPDAFE